MLTDKSKHEQHILLPVLKKYLRNHTHLHLLESIHFHEGIIMDQISRQVILVGGLSAYVHPYIDPAMSCCMDYCLCLLCIIKPCFIPIHFVQHANCIALR